MSLVRLAGMLLFAEPAVGDAFALEWEAPASCPSRVQLHARIGELVGAQLERADDEPLRVVASAQRAADGAWRVQLELWSRGEVRHRTIPRGRDCAEVAEAVAVVVAIAIDPGVATRIASGEDATIPEAPVVPEPTEDARPPAVEPEVPGDADPDPIGDEPTAALPIDPPEPAPRAPAKRERPRAMLALLGGIGTGTLPGAAGSLGGEVGLLLPRVRVSATGSWWFRTRTAVEDASVDFGQWSIAVRGCPVFGVARVLELMACAGVEAGQMLARTDGLREDRTRADPWAAGLVTPMLAVVPTRWLAVRAGAELVVPFTRSRYEVGGFGPVFQPTPVGIRGLLALEARFP